MRYLLLLVLIAGCAHADRQDRRVRVENDTSTMILAFFASTVAEDTWEEDILGDSVIPPWDAVIVNIDDGSGYCRYDLRAIFADGTDIVRNDVNVCETNSWTLYE